MHFIEQTRKRDLSRSYLATTSVILTISINFFCLKPELAKMLIHRIPNDDGHSHICRMLTESLFTSY